MLLFVSVTPASNWYAVLAPSPNVLFQNSCFTVARSRNVTQESIESTVTSTKVQHKYRKHKSTISEDALAEMICINPNNIFYNQYHESYVCSFRCKCKCPATSAESCRSVSLSLPAVCPVSHFCTFSELSLALDTL